MEIKVCGVTTLEQLQELQEIGVHYAGLIFYEGSKRNVIEKLKDHKETIAELDISRIGVFVDEEEDVIRKAIDDYALAGIQLHGNETPAFCARFMEKVNVIKSFHIADDTDIDGVINAYHGSCNYYLFDTASDNYGGSGKKFNWNRLNKETIDKLFFLSGGIGPDDADDVARFYHPFLYAVDINSRFETEPGIKNMDLIRQFIQTVSDISSDPNVRISLNT